MHECISGKRDRVWLGVFFHGAGRWGRRDDTNVYLQIECKSLYAAKYIS